MTNVISGDTLIFALKLKINNQEININETSYSIYVVIENNDSKYSFEMIENSQEIYGVPLINIPTSCTKEMKGVYDYRFFLKDKSTNDNQPLTANEQIRFNRSVTTIDG